VTFQVLLSGDAEGDIEDIYDFVTRQDGAARADDLLTDLETACDSLADFPERGNVPKELSPLGMTEFREIHVKPYRILYRIFAGRVIVYGVFDGRRDMQSLLQRRLLR